MKIYKIKLNYETEIEAYDEADARCKFFEDIENEPQQNLANFIEDHLIIDRKLDEKK